MAGAFLEGNAEESVSTMGVFPLREPAEEFANRDRIPMERHVLEWYIRKWDNMFSVIPYPSRAFSHTVIQSPER
jgi:hypothetical protein